MDAFNLKRFNILSGDIAVRNSLVSIDGRMLTEYVPRAFILDIRIGAATIQSIAAARPYKSGSDFIRRRHATRVIEIDVELPLEYNTYPENVHMLRAWADSPHPRDMVLSAYPDRRIPVSCTNINEFSQGQWWFPVTLRFEAWEPYFISRSPKTAPVNQQFTVSGDVEPLVNLSHPASASAPLNSPKWTLDGAKYVMLNTNINSGQVEIDFDKGTITRNDVSIASNLTLTSSFAPFMDIQPGNHTITGPSGGVVTWYERWL